MKKLLIFCTCVLTVTLLTPVISAKEETVRTDVVRFHVRANSDSRFDQQLKLLVRDEAVSLAKDLTKNCKNANDAYNTLGKNLDGFAVVAERVLKNAGVVYGVKVRLTEEDFPERSYGGVVFPKGRYRALRIDLGRAEGENFWCVLFPPICLADACTEQILLEYGVDAYTNDPPRLVIRFKIWESIKKLFKL